MKISDFNYDLPEKLIAKHPPKVRGASRFLVLDRQTGQIEDRRYAELDQFLNSGDVLVLNNTRVMKSRIFARKANGARRELIILEKHSSDTDWHRHKVMYRGRLAVGDGLVAEANPFSEDRRLGRAPLNASEEKRFAVIGDDCPTLKVVEILGGGIAVVESKEDLLELTEKFGAPPLPPYLHRDATPGDTKRYQTVFARDPGSAAAPTASLNMTDELLDRLRAKGVIIKYLTLHVGLGTFMPIRTDEVENHKMHSEYFEIPADTIEAIKHAKQSDSRVVALGTTVARTLEYAFPGGPPGKSENSTTGEADIFIYPGYQFHTVDALLTNFHAPKSTVLMLASAFAGWDNLKTAYAHAKAENYAFLSYGDSMFIK